MISIIQRLYEKFREPEEYYAIRRSDLTSKPSNPELIRKPKANCLRKIVAGKWHCRALLAVFVSLLPASRTRR